MVEILDIILQNPILIISLGMDVGLGVTIIKNMLHPYLGNFDIALILKPLEPQQEEKKITEKKMWMMTSRVEFNPDREVFRVGKGDGASSYRVDPSKVAFIQRHHRVYYYEYGKAYPLSYAYGMNTIKTTAKGMDIFIIQQLWKQAVAATQKLNFALPILVMIMCVAAGAGLGFMAFYFVHPGFVAAGTQPIVTTATTATFGG